MIAYLDNLLISLMDILQSIKTTIIYFSGNLYPWIALWICILLNSLLFLLYIVSNNKKYIIAGFAILIIDLYLIIYLLM
jgi:hypothetical protein